MDIRFHHFGLAFVRLSVLVLLLGIEPIQLVESWHVSLGLRVRLLCYVLCQNLMGLAGAVLFHQELLQIVVVRLHLLVFGEVLYGLVLSVHDCLVSVNDLLLLEHLELFLAHLCQVRSGLSGWQLSGALAL